MDEEEFDQGEKKNYFRYQNNKDLFIFNSFSRNERKEKFQIKKKE
jgi:hypothetical protein